MSNEVSMKKIFELFITFFKLGLFTFGGGYAMISLIQSECVDKKKWLTEEELLDIVAIAESTPGPIAINSATYIGHKIGGVLGSIMAVLGVVLPSFAIIYLISLFFDYFSNLPHLLHLPVKIEHILQISGTFVSGLVAFLPHSLHSQSVNASPPPSR